ncbi:MAG: ATP-dependent RNA helicase HrpA [Candidatus Accumulibacter sp.]|jgi:ATP-dependent helicase HrpA|nr:ATP-dependent RNA helicase HrpA [Accumulibacter sp.]
MLSSFSGCLTADQQRLRAIARDLRRLEGAARKAAQAEYDFLLERSRAAVAARRESLPRLAFPGELPVNARRAEIAEAISKNPVIIVCGETGSGKTTQLPKICLESGRGITGLIGHTQPRRIAARSTASRIARELESELGDFVGYKIRFSDRVSPRAYIKVMTDGILLAETQGDPWLSRYDTLIVDEAHERSLNIDFLLGYLKRLLRKRPDLRLIVTSATIDAKRFSSHFALDGKDAPVIEVSGRMFPVEIRYRPMREEVNGADGRESAEPAESPNSAPPRDPGDERDLYGAVADACDELVRAGPGDILVFLPGEREIREMSEILRKRAFGRAVGKGAAEILPLFARLSVEEQARIFKPHGGRRIVLSTNVAETSLTVPGIRYVVDTGLARIKRYSYRNKVEQLRIEKISRASADQRAGRCGRLEAGICVRLYDADDYGRRPEFTDPEILRSSLAGVILRMKALDLGDIESFPFIEMPPPKAISDGFRLLRELGATDAAAGDAALTPTGHELARMPLDPRVARMIVEARREGCVNDVLIIASALSVRDPRERTAERQTGAARRKFDDEKSEFLSWIRLWTWYENEIAHKKSRRQIARECGENFLSAARMREWRDVYGQLAALLAERGWEVKGAGDHGPAKFSDALDEVESGSAGLSRTDYAALHRALLSGLLGNIGQKLEELPRGAPPGAQYLGARGIRFAVHPGSPLAGKAGKWIVAAEITETSRLFARCVARIEPEWIEKIAAHLIKKSCFDPHWEKNAMRAIAFERSTLYGLVIEPRKRVNYGEINSKEARDIFIRQGLAGGEIAEDYARRWGFYAHNRRLIRDIEALEHKSRRPDILVDDELIAAFYDRVIPEGIVDGPAFDAWRREAERTNPKLLYLEREDLMRHEAAGVTTDAFPRVLCFNGVDFALSYHFGPGSAKDGVTLTVPLAQLNRIPEDQCEWLIPGLLREKVLQLVKTLPQKIRAKLGPVPDFAAAFVEFIESAENAPLEKPYAERGLIPALIRFIVETRGINARGWELTPDAFRPDVLPPHLFFNFRLVDGEGGQLAMSRDLAGLRAQWGSQAREEFSGAREIPEEYSGMTGWTFGELPEFMEVETGGQKTRGYPGLHDDGDSVSLRIFDTSGEARAVHAKGLLRLFRLHFREQIKYLERNLLKPEGAGMAFMTIGTPEELRAQLIDVALARACMTGPWPSCAEGFRERCAAAKPKIGLLAQEIDRLAAAILAEWRNVRKKLSVFKAHTIAARDIEKQLSRLFVRCFIAETPFERLQHFPRYLKAVSMRLDKLGNDPARDARLMADYLPLWTNYERRAETLARQGVDNPRMEQFRWLLEELRVHLFAQELRTPAPVSVKRLQKMWESV